jgi:hypothetical protein
MPCQDTYVSYPSRCAYVRVAVCFGSGSMALNSFICVTKFLSISTCAYCRAVGYSPACHRSPQCEPGVPHEPARLHEYLTSVR